MALFLCRRWSSHHSLNNHQLAVYDAAQVSDGSYVLALPVVIPIQMVFACGHFSAVRPEMIQAHGWVLADVAPNYGEIVAFGGFLGTRTQPISSASTNTLPFESYGALM